MEREIIIRLCIQSIGLSRFFAVGLGVWAFVLVMFYAHTPMVRSPWLLIFAVLCLAGSCVHIWNIKNQREQIEQLYKEIDEEAKIRKGIINMEYNDKHKNTYDQQSVDNPAVVKCLTCKHCLPPSSRNNDRMCNKDSCSFEKA